MKISEVPDSEEFTHFDERGGEVNAIYIDKENAKIDFIDDGELVTTAYFNFQGLKALYHEIEQVLMTMSDPHD